MARKRVLFQVPEEGWRTPGRVVLNWIGDPIRELEIIAESYQSVARERVELLKSTRGTLRAGDEFEAYPIVFLYRQAFELSLKAIVFAGAVLLREMGEEPMRMKELMRHDLMPLFQEVSRIFTTMTAGDAWDFGEPELLTRADFEEIVREFDEIDRGSYTFRYSVKKNGTSPSLDKGFEFDLFAFAAIMDRIVPALAGAPGWIRDEMQERWEAAYEAQQDAWADAEHDPPEYDLDIYDQGDADPDPY